MRTFISIAVVATLVAVVHCSTNCTGTSRNEGLLYPHMANNGDTEFLPRRDDQKKTLKIKGKYSLMGTKYRRKLYVVTNGILAMTKTGIPKDYNPTQFSNQGTPFIAPAYSDVDIQFMLNGPEASHIWFRETKDSALRSRFEEDIAGYFTGCGGGSFKPKFLVIVTYQRVQSYCDHFYISKRKRDVDDKSDDEERPDEEKRSGPINTFQLVYATNKAGTPSFVMFNYQCLSWNNCWSYTRAGFNDGAGNVEQIDGSGSSSFINNDINSNVGKPGRFIYRVDSAIQEPDCSAL